MTTFEQQVAAGHTARAQKELGLAQQALKEAQQAAKARPHKFTAVVQRAQEALTRRRATLAECQRRQRALHPGPDVRTQIAELVRAPAQYRRRVAA